jgi:C1A family cysteine protease
MHSHSISSQQGQLTSFQYNILFQPHSNRQKSFIVDPDKLESVMRNYKFGDFTYQRLDHTESEEYNRALLDRAESIIQASQNLQIPIEIKQDEFQLLFNNCVKKKILINKAKNLNPINKQIKEDFEKVLKAIEAEKNLFISYENEDCCDMLVEGIKKGFSNISSVEFDFRRGGNERFRQYYWDNSKITGLVFLKNIISVSPEIQKLIFSLAHLETKSPRVLVTLSHNQDIAPLKERINNQNFLVDLYHRLKRSYVHFPQVDGFENFNNIEDLVNRNIKDRGSEQKPGEDIPENYREFFSILSERTLAGKDSHIYGGSGSGKGLLINNLKRILREQNIEKPVFEITCCHPLDKVEDQINKLQKEQRERIIILDEIGKVFSDFAIALDSSLKPSDTLIFVDSFRKKIVEKSLNEKAKNRLSAIELCIELNPLNNVESLLDFFTNKENNKDISQNLDKLLEIECEICSSQISKDKMLNVFLEKINEKLKNKEIGGGGIREIKSLLYHEINSRYEIASKYLEFIKRRESSKAGLMNRQLVSSNPRGFGAMQDPQSLNDHVFEEKSSINDLILKAPAFSLRSKISGNPIINQGCLQTCTAVTICTMMSHIQKTQFQKNIRFSPMFTYFKSRMYLLDEKGDKSAMYDTGCYLRAVMKVANKFGLVEEKEWPYNTNPNGINKPPKDITTLLDLSKNNRAVSFERIPTDRKNINNTKNLIKIALMKKELMVGCSVKLYEESYTQAEKTGKIVLLPNDRPKGLHAIVIVGFDDSKQAFEIRNSYGDGWGQQGYGYLSYEYLKQDIFDIWVITGSTGEQKMDKRFFNI